MENVKNCPFCGSTNLGIGYYLGAGSLFADAYAYHSTHDFSSVECLLCKECGSVVHMRVTNPQIFRQSSLARQDELLDYIEGHGLICVNDCKELPSLSSLGYSWENLTGLIDQHHVFYCKAYQKRSVYLSREAYLLLKKCRRTHPMGAEEAKVYDFLKITGVAEKSGLRSSLSSMDKKDFDKAFDFLLENLYITAFQNGKWLNSTWSSFVYSTSERWENEVPKLHFHGDTKERLRGLFRDIDEKEFEKLLK